MHSEDLLVPVLNKNRIPQYPIQTIHPLHLKLCLSCLAIHHIKSKYNSCKPLTKIDHVDDHWLPNNKKSLISAQHKNFQQKQSKYMLITQISAKSLDPFHPNHSLTNHKLPHKKIKTYPCNLYLYISPFPIDIENSY